MSFLCAPPGYNELLWHHTSGSYAQPFFLGPVHRGRQPAVHHEYPLGQRFQPVWDAGGDKLRAALGPRAPAAPDSALPPHAVFLQTHLSGAEASVQPHPVTRLLALLWDTNGSGNRTVQWTLCQVRCWKVSPVRAKWDVRLMCCFYFNFLPQHVILLSSRTDSMLLRIKYKINK